MKKDIKKKIFTLLIIVGVITSSFLFLFPFTEALQDDSDLEVTLHCRLESSSGDMVSTLMPTGDYDFWEEPELDIGSFSHDTSTFIFDDCQLGTYNETGIMNITNQNTNFKANNTDLDEYEVSISNDATMELELNYTAGYNESFYTGTIDAESYTGDIDSLETFDNDQLIIDDFEYVQDDGYIITSRTNTQNTYWFNTFPQKTVSYSYTNTPEDTEEMANYDRLYCKQTNSFYIKHDFYTQLQYKLALGNDIIDEINSGTEYELRVYFTSSHDTGDGLLSAKVWYELLDGTSQQQYNSHSGGYDYSFTEDYTFIIDSTNLYQGNSLRLQLKTYTQTDEDDSLPYTDVWAEVDNRIYLIQFQARKQALLDLVGYQKTVNQENNVLNAFLNINESVVYSDTPIQLQMYNGTEYQTIATHSNINYEYSQITIPDNLNYYSTFNFRLWIVCSPTNNHENQQFMCESLNLSTYYKGKGVFDLINATEFKYSILAVEYSQNITLGLVSNTELNDYWVKSIYTFSSADFDYYEYTSSLTILNQNASYYFDLATNITVYIANFSTSYSSSESRVPSEINLELNNQPIIDQSLKGGYIAFDDFQDTLSITATEYIYFELNITVDFTFTFSLDVISKTYLSKTFILESDHSIFIESIDFSDDLEIWKIYLNNIDKGSSNPCNLIPDVEMGSGNEFTLDIILSEEIYLPLQYLKNNLGSGTANIYLCGTANSVYYYNVNGNLVYTISVPSGHDPFYADLIFTDIVYTPEYIPNYANDLSGYSYGSSEYGDENVNWGAEYYQTNANGTKLGESGGSGYEQILAEYFSALNGYMSHTYGDLDSQNMTYTISDYLYMENLFPSNLTFEEWNSWVHSYDNSYINSSNYFRFLSNLIESYDTGALGGNDEAWGIYWDGTYFYVDDADGSVYKYDSGFTTIIDTYNIGDLGDNDNQADMCFDGTYYYVVDWSDAVIYKYNSDFSSLLDSYNIGVLGGNDYPSGISWDGTYFYVGDVDDAVVYKYNSDFSSLLDSYNIGTLGFVQSSGLYWDGSYFYIGSFLDSVCKVNSDFSLLIDNITLQGITYSRDIIVVDTYMYVTDHVDDLVYKYASYNFLDSQLQSYHYPATYSFTDEVGETGIDIDFTDYAVESDGCTLSIISEFNEHAGVLEFDDVSNSGFSRSIHEFSDTQTDATVEFWIAKDNVGADTLFRVVLEEGTDDIVYMLFKEDDLQSYTGSSWQNVKMNYASANTWYHIKLVLDDSINMYYCYIDGEYQGKFDYDLDSEIGITRVSIATDSSDTGYTCYIDAWGESWDSNYQVGDNLYWTSYQGTHTFEDYNLTESGWYSGYDSFDYRMDEGYYKGSAGFNYETVGTIGTDIDWVDTDTSSSNCEIKIIDELDDHENVLELDDKNGAGSCSLYHTYSSSNKIIEFWITKNDTGSGTTLYFYIYESATHCVRIEFNSDDVRYYNGTDWITIETNFLTVYIFSHIKIELDDSTNTFDFYIDGTLVGDDLLYYQNSVSGTNNIFLSTDSSGEHKIYIDGFGIVEETDSEGYTYQECWNVNPYDIDELLDADFTFAMLALSDSYVKITDEVDEHYNVLDIYDNQSNIDDYDIIQMYHYFDLVDQTQSSGTIEFWMRSTDTTKTNEIRMCGSGGAGPRIYFSNGIIKTYDGSLHDVCIGDSNTWYHIRVDFDCSTDTFDIYVNGTNQGNFNFNSDLDNIWYLYIRSEASQYDYHFYMDAFDFSWRDGYDEGDNLNPYGEQVLEVLENNDWTIAQLDYECGIGITGEFNEHIKSLTLLDNSSDGYAYVYDTFSAITSDQSIEFWIKTSDATNKIYIVIRGYTANDEAIRFYIKSEKLTVFDGNSTTDICPVYDNIWLHIYIVWDYSEKTFDLYVNSTLEADDFDFRYSGVASITYFLYYSENSGSLYNSNIDSLSYSWENAINDSLTLNSEELLDVYADITQTYTNTLLNRYLYDYWDFQKIYNITIEFEYIWTTLNSSYIEDAQINADGNSIDLELASDWTHAEINFLYNAQDFVIYDLSDEMINYANGDICYYNSYFYVTDEYNDYIRKYDLDFNYITYYDLSLLGGNDNIRGICWNDTYFHVADYTDKLIYVYNSDFSSLITTYNYAVASPNDIILSLEWDGSSFYAVISNEFDPYFRVYKYNLDFSSYVSYDIGSLGGNDDALGICWDGVYFYITDYNDEDIIYVYNSDFSSLITTYSLYEVDPSSYKFGMCYYNSYFYVCEPEFGIVHRYNSEFTLTNMFDTIFNITNGELYIRNMNYTLFFEAVDINNYNRLYQFFRYNPTFSLEYLQQIRGCWILNFTYDFNATDDYPYYDFYNTVDHSLLRIEIHLNSEGGWNTPYVFSYNNSQNNINICFNITDYLNGLGQYIFSDFYIDIYLSGNPSSFILDDLILYDFDSDFYLVDLLWITDTLLISHQNKTCYWRSSDEYISNVEITELYDYNTNLIYNITLINNTLQYQVWNNYSCGFYELNFTFFDEYGNWEIWTLNYTIIERIAISVGYENPKFIDQINTVEVHILTDYSIISIWYDNSTEYILYYDNSSYPHYSDEFNFTLSYSIECSYNISIKVIGEYNDTFFINITNLCFIERTTLLDFQNLYSSYYQNEVFNVTYILRDTYNNPLQNEVLNFTIIDPYDIVIVNSSNITDSSGEINYSFNFSLSYSVGFYHLNVSYSGTTQYNSVSKLQSFQVRPIERSSNSTEIGLKVNGYYVNNSQIRINGTNVFNITNNDYSIFDIEIQLALSYSETISYNNYLRYTYTFSASSMLSYITYTSANLTNFPSNFTDYYFDDASSTNYIIIDGNLSINDLVGEKFYHLYDFMLGLYYLDDTDIQREQLTDNPRTDIDSVEFKEYLTANRTFRYWYLINSYTINSFNLNHTRTDSIISYSGIINEGSKYYFEKECLSGDLFEATLDYDPDWDINYDITIKNGTYCSIDINYKSDFYIENVTLAINLTVDNVYAENWTHGATQSIDTFVLEVDNITFTTSYQSIILQGNSTVPYSSFSSFSNEESFTISENDYDDIDEYFTGYLSYPYYSQSFLVRVNSSWTPDGIHYQGDSYDITNTGYFECPGWGTGITGSYLRFKTNPITNVERYMKDDEGKTKEVVYRIDSELPASDIDIEVYIEEEEYVTIKDIIYEGDSVDNEDIKSFKLVKFKDRTYYQIMGVDISKGTNKIKIIYKTENVFNYAWLFLPVFGGLAMIGFIYWKIRYKNKKKTGGIDSIIDKIILNSIQFWKKFVEEMKESNKKSWEELKMSGKNIKIKR